MAEKSTKNRHPSVTIIGPGRLGLALALALQSQRYEISVVVAQRAESARRAAKTLQKRGRLPKAFGANQLSALPPSDLTLITTPDDAIAQIARQLAAVKAEDRSKRSVLHTSGALASDELSPLAKVGFHTGSLHPLVSVSEPAAGAEALRGAFFCLEGDTVALRVARAIVRDLNGKSFSIPADKKALYHAAAVMASPHLTALVDLAIEMLAACGVSKRTAKKVLVPLLQSTVKNLEITNPQQALTGTFARGDVSTVRKHLDVLSGGQPAEAFEVYKLLGLHSVELAQRNGLDPARLEEIRRLLKAGGDANGR